MSRKLTDLVDDQTEKSLHALVTSANDKSVSEYQQVMIELGRDLGSKLNGELESVSTTYMAFTVEDADFLAKGLIDSLVEGNSSKLAGVACFWNERHLEGGVKTTPILRSYKERAENVQTLVIVKSIISSACVVKTNLTKLIGEISPEKIFIVAPVMFEGSEQLLKDEFPEYVSSKFSFLTFAVDSKRLDSGLIEPGIGGSVYENLGLGDEKTKNTYVPALVTERRAALTN